MYGIHLNSFGRESMLKKMPPNAKNSSINNAPTKVAIGMLGEAADINMDALVKPTLPNTSNTKNVKK